MINSTVAIEQCHHRDAAGLISTFLTLAVIYLENSTFQHLQLNFHFFCGPSHYYALL